MKLQKAGAVVSVQGFHGLTMGRFTAIPQPEETEVLTGLLQRDGGETCAEALAAFAIGIFFLGRMLSHELYAVEAVFWPAGGAIPESQSCCQAS